MKTAMVFLLWALIAGTASASVYKCTGADGKTEFSDKPCEGTNSEPMELQYNTFEGAKGEPENAKTSKEKIARKTKAIDKKPAEASPGASKASAKGASKTAKAAATTKRAEKANERRFIREGMTTAEVRSRIDTPDSQEAGACRERTMVTSKKQLKTVRDLCEKCWIYEPVEGDLQTRTHVCFQNGLVSSVTRKVVR